MTGDRRERRNVAILGTSWALFLIAAITVMTLSGLVGERLAPTPALATAPIAATMLGVVAATLPASLFMKRHGRRAGFVLGALVGAAGGGLSVVGIAAEVFAVFVGGNLLLGVYQAFANYYRFAAADAASPGWRSRAISLVMAGGIVAAFLGPWNVRYAIDLLPTPDAGPYAVVVALALAATLALGWLRVPGEAEARSGAQRPIRAIASQPEVPIAVTASAAGYALMILVMTATPLAMRTEGFGMGEIATVMQWHVLGMFAPSFVTGHLIARYTTGRVLLAGVALMGTAGVTAAAGTTLPHFGVALVLLGVGWNFLFVGGSTLLAVAHTPAERGKVQGANDLLVFTAVAVGSLLAGTLLHLASWASLNLAMLPVLGAVALVVLRWQRQPVGQPQPSPTGEA
jgi:MFS family permease